MTCATCETGQRYWFDSSCRACMARHYVWVLLPREQTTARARLRAQLTAEEFGEFRRLVESERAKARDEGSRRGNG